jgi:hypothetical protein
LNCYYLGMDSDAVQEILGLAPNFRDAILSEVAAYLDRARLMRLSDETCAVQVGNIGSTPDKRGRNLQTMRRYIRSLHRKIERLLGIEQKTLWDRLGKSKRF